MTWTTPIYDRVLSDVTTPTAKGYFNVADWTRIYDNAAYVNAEILTNTGHTVTFTTITAPTTSIDPTTIITKFNTLLANIEAMRLYVNLHGASISAMTNLVYTAGAGEIAPSYIDVNQWEYILYQIKIFTDANMFDVYLLLEDNTSRLLLETGDKILLE